jgi:hypothetical protein
VLICFCSEHGLFFGLFEFWEAPIITIDNNPCSCHLYIGNINFIMGLYIYLGSFLNTLQEVDFLVCSKLRTRHIGGDVQFFCSNIGSEQILYMRVQISCTKVVRT